MNVARQFTAWDLLKAIPSRRDGVILIAACVLF
jgi:hypothetical protein